MTLHEIVLRIPDARMIGEDDAIARCPAHDDKRPSLKLRQGDGKVMVYCFAGCSFRAISSALGLDPRDWFNDSDLDRASRPAKVYRLLEHDSRVAMVEAYWREVDRLGRDLRSRDLRRIAISRRVRAGKMTEDDALDLLASIYDGYSEMEARWQELINRKEPRL